MAGTPEQHVWILRNQLTNVRATLQEEERQKNELQHANQVLEGLVKKQKSDVSKLTIHAKNCEKATGKAQKEAKQAKGNAEHLIESQKGQLKNAERRYEIAARELQEWKDNYGETVDGPAKEKHALQVSVAEWQSKVEEARNEIVSLEAQIQGTPEQVGLHQALEEWEEHQRCSAGFAEFEDKIHEAKVRQQKLESDLAASRQSHQKVKSDLKKLQTQQAEQAEQLKQANNAIPDQDKVNEYSNYIQQLESDLRASIERHQQMDEEFKALKANAALLEQANKAMQDQNKTNEYIQYIQQLESELQASTERHQQTEKDLKAQYIQQLESELQASTERHQQTEKDLKAQYIQQLESELQASTERYQQSQADLKELQEKSDEILKKTDVDMVDEDMLQNKKLKTDLKTYREQLDKTESDMKALQKKAEQLEQANMAFQDQDESRKISFQKLESDHKASREQCQEIESTMKEYREKSEQLETDLKLTKQQHQTTMSNMDALMKDADELEVVLKTAREQHETAELNMKAIQEKADQLVSDLNAKEQQYQTSSSNAGALQEKVDRLESNLISTKERYESAASDLKTLEAKSDQLEQANKAYQEKEDERLQAKTSKEVEQDKNENDEVADAMQQDEKRFVLIDQTNSMKPEQDTKARQLQAEHIQVSSFTHISAPLPSYPI